jgi:cadmium resistance protein CadD (predicted permease)
MGESDDRVVAFERSERRRKSLIYIVLGLFMMLAGGVAIVVILSAASDKDLRQWDHSGRGNGYSILVWCGGIALFGLISLVVGIRIGRGKAKDFDMIRDAQG